MSGIMGKTSKRTLKLDAPRYLHVRNAAVAEFDCFLPRYAVIMGRPQHTTGRESRVGEDTKHRMANRSCPLLRSSQFRR